MGKYIVTGLVGAGIVFAAGKANAYVNTPGADGSMPVDNAFLQQWAAPLAGGIALVAALAIAHKVGAPIAS